MEQGTTTLIFGPFRLFPIQRRLWKDENQIEIRKMPLAVLTYLAQHPNRVVPIEELRQAVWGSTYVSRTTVRVCVREVRQALGEEKTAPRYIETVGRQGYCFIGFNNAESAAKQNRSAAMHPQRLTTERLPRPELFVGRQRELAQLQEWRAQAQEGQRQIVLVSGEAGIGKTTLVKQFIAQLPVDSGVWVGRGQCVESHGGGEAYLPILEALGRLGREGGTGKLVATLQQYAPTWLMQLPALIDVATREELLRQSKGTTQERMLREMCDAMEALTATQPLLLVLEDLHWSDPATLTLLAALARRPDPARLLIIGSYRPADAILQTHPLRGLVQELRAHQLCREVRLEMLSAEEVKTYVHQRFESRTVADKLGPPLYERTDGNPLFLTTSVDTLLQQGLVAETDGQWTVCGDLNAVTNIVPEDLQQLITKQIEALSVEEQQILEVASVSSPTFTAATVAAGCQQNQDTVEAACDRLVQHRQVIEGDAVEEWPDGTCTARYSFRHALFRDVLYRRLGNRRRIQLHRVIAEQLEAAYKERASEIASELAEHFSQGRDYRKGAQYRLHAANKALRLSAYREALTHCQQGLALLTHTPATVERDRQELAIRMPFHEALGATYGLGAQEVEENLKHAQELARKVNDEKALVSMVIALGRLYVARADRAGALKVAEEDDRLVQRIRDPALLIQLHTQLGTIHTFRAEYAQARAHQTQVQTLYTTAGHQSLIFSSGMDPLMLMYSLSNLNLCLAGWLDRSRRQQHNLVARGAQLQDRFSNVYANSSAAFVAVLRGDLDEARQLVNQGTHLATQDSFPMYSAVGRALQGCIAVRSGDPETGIAILKKALPDYRATDAQTILPFFLSFLAEGLARCGKSEEAFATLAEALRLSETGLEALWEAELYRVKGELILQSQTNQRQVTSKSRASQPMSRVQRLEAEAEACFLKAIEIARRQDAKVLELRAAVSLVRLRQRQTTRRASRPMYHGTHTRLDEAYEALSKVYNWFTEGFDSEDLQTAQTLLTEWTTSPPFAAPPLTQKW